MPHGGKREGSGRKKSPEGIAYRKALLNLIEKNKKGLAQALIDKGLGGDVPALKEINERSLGKVKENLDVHHSFSLTELFTKSVESE